MTSVTPPPKPELFSIFIWPNVKHGRAVSWQGQLKRLPDGTITYFATWEELVAQIQQYVAKSEEVLQQGLDQSSSEKHEKRKGKEKI